MKNEEIEQLLAEYVSGEISAENMAQLTLLFTQDPKLKHEADEMLAVWQGLDKVEQNVRPGTDMDAQFYTMLQRAKQDKANTLTKIVTINKVWLQVAAAIIICITAFSMGRFTATPVAILKYKTVYVKQPVQVEQIIKPTSLPNPLIAKLPRKHLKKPDAVEDNSALAQQLRSVYASERIGAVMKITGKGNLSNADLQRLQLALKEDPNSNVRLTILDALRPLAAQQNVQAVLINALDEQNDNLIKSSIVDMLIDVKSKRAIPQMIALLDDKKTNETMQNKIKAGIESFLN